MLGVGGLEHTKPVDYNGKILIGKVVDNNDPEQMERVRIECKEVFGDAAVEDLPWAIPEQPNCIGNTATAGWFGVPVLNSIVYFKLQEGDPTFPVWTGMPVNPQTKKGLAATNYPHRYGFVDEKGNHFYVDRQTDDIEFHHMSGTQVHITPAGGVQVNIVENETINVEGNVNMTVGGNVTANIDGNLDVQAGGTGRIQSGGNLTLQGANVTIIGSTIAHQGTVTGTSTATYSGNVVGAGISLNSHRHTGVQTGGGQTGTPV